MKLHEVKIIPIIVTNKWQMGIKLPFNYFAVFRNADPPTQTLEQKMGRSFDTNQTYMWTAPVYRWIGWSMKNSNHYKFCTIYSSASHFFIRMASKIQCMMNSRVVSVVIINHQMFVMDRVLQRCFRNHNGCGVTLTTITLSFFRKLYVGLLKY